MPLQNKRDLEEIDPQVRKKLKFHFVDRVEQVLELALGKREMNKVKKRTALRAAAKH